MSLKTKRRVKIALKWESNRLTSNHHLVPCRKENLRENNKRVGWNERHPSAEHSNNSRWPCLKQNY